MKANQLGTLAIIVVVALLTAACNGSPTKPSTTNPSLGNGAPAALVNVSNPQPVAAGGQTCTSQPQDQTGDGSNADTPAVTCDSPVVADQPATDVVVSDGSTMESARFVHRLHR
jgi:hypothetical protein